MLVAKRWSKVVGSQLTLFFNASVFLTRFPAPNWVRFSAKLLELSAVYFPLVGLIVGLFGAASYAAFLMVFPPAIALLLMMALCVYVTGAFHEDGWADTCDALGGGYTPDAIKKIMKDSRLGTYGVVGIVGMLAIKFLALFTLASSTVEMLLIFIFAQGYSRWLALTVMWQLPYVQDSPGSKSKPLASAISGAILCRSGIPLLLLSVAFFSVVAFDSFWLGIIALAFGYAGREYMAQKLKRAIGGFTGDGLGAVQQLSEVLFYLGCVAVLHP